MLHRCKYTSLILHLYGIEEQYLLSLLGFIQFLSYSMVSIMMTTGRHYMYITEWSPGMESWGGFLA